jgi:hypothetical protein
MKIVRKTIVLLLLVGQFLSPILSLADEIVNDIPSPGTVYDDLNGDYGILGIACFPVPHFYERDGYVKRAYEWKCSCCST